MLRHAVLGAGGIGGLVAAALARAGREVVLIVRTPDHPGVILVESQVLGDFTAEVRAVTRLDTPVDILWVTVKATQLHSALGSAPADLVTATVIPLLNGIDHFEALRAVYPTVTAGTIAVESERVAAGHIVQPQPFISVQLVGRHAEAACAELTAAGIPCSVQNDAATILWRKLLVLAPLALTTTALDAPLGEVRQSPEWNRRLLQAVDEAGAVAIAEGARVDPQVAKTALGAAPASFRSSMQKDRAARRPLELDHIAGPVQRGGHRHGIPTPVFDELAAMLRPVAEGEEGS